LDFLAACGAPAQGEDYRELQVRMASWRARSGSIWWQPDGDVVLRQAVYEGVQQVVPDATVCSVACPVRVFVELDRSTHGLSKIQTVLHRYLGFVRGEYRRLYQDGRAPALLYSTRSEARRQHIFDLCTRTFGDTMTWAVVLERDAPAWFERTLLSESRPAVGDALGSAVAPAGIAPAQVQDDLTALLRQIYKAARAHAAVLQSEGRALPRDLEELLLQAHEKLGRARRAA
jgi:hypothetical protein